MVTTESMNLFVIDIYLNKIIHVNLYSFHCQRDKIDHLFNYVKVIDQRGNMTHQQWHMKAELLY